jgi:hypothetical protein
MNHLPYENILALVVGGDKYKSKKQGGGKPNGNGKHEMQSRVARNWKRGKMAKPRSKRPIFSKGVQR